MWRSTGNRRSLNKVPSWVLEYWKYMILKHRWALLLSHSMKITLVGSPFTHAAESHYAPGEGKALAVADTLNKAHLFVLGCIEIIIAIDHKFLLKIFGDRSLNDISNARLRNLREKTLCYKFHMVCIPGVQHKVANTLSRHPTGSTSPEMLELPDDIVATSETPFPLPASYARHSFMAGIHSNESPLQSYSTTTDS